MMLAPRQVLLLTEMGIPVWELRSTEETVVETIEPPVDTAALLQRVALSDWLICVDNILTEQTYRLLHAMLLTIGLSHADICLLSLAEAKKLVDIDVNVKQKVLFLLGDQAVKQVFEQSAAVSDYRNEAHFMPHIQLATVVSFGLEDLMQIPENKVLAWQDLQLAKNIQQQQL